MHFFPGLVREKSGTFVIGQVNLESRKKSGNFKLMASETVLTHIFEDRLSRKLIYAENYRALGKRSI